MNPTDTPTPERAPMPIEAPPGTLEGFMEGLYRFDENGGPFRIADAEDRAAEAGRPVPADQRKGFGRNDLTWDQFNRSVPLNNSYTRLKTEYERIEGQVRANRLSRDDWRALQRGILAHERDLDEWERGVVDYRVALAELNSSLNRFPGTPVAGAYFNAALTTQTRSILETFMRLARETDTRTVRDGNENRTLTLRRRTLELPVVQRTNAIARRGAALAGKVMPQPPQGSEASGLTQMREYFEVLQNKFFQTMTGIPVDAGGLLAPEADVIDGFKRQAPAMEKALGDMEALAARYEKECEAFRTQPVTASNDLLRRQDSLRQRLNLGQLREGELSRLIQSLGDPLPEPPAEGARGFEPNEVTALRASHPNVVAARRRARAMLVGTLLRSEANVTTDDDFAECRAVFYSALTQTSVYLQKVVPMVKDDPSKLLQMSRVIAHFGEGLLACQAAQGAHTGPPTLSQVHDNFLRTGNYPPELRAHFEAVMKANGSVVIDNPARLFDRGTNTLTAEGRSVAQNAARLFAAGGPEATLILGQGLPPEVAAAMRAEIVAQLQALGPDGAALARRILMGFEGLETITDPALRREMLKGLKEAEQLMAKNGVPPDEFARMLRAARGDRVLIGEAYVELKQFFKGAMTPGMYFLSAMSLAHSKDKFQGIVSLSMMLAGTAVLDVVILDTLMYKALGPVLVRKLCGTGPAATRAAAAARLNGMPPALRLTIVLGACIWGGKYINQAAEWVDKHVAASRVKSFIGDTADFVFAGGLFSEKQQLQMYYGNRQIDPVSDWQRICGMETAGEYVQHPFERLAQLGPTILDAGTMQTGSLALGMRGQNLTGLTTRDFWNRLVDNRQRYFRDRREAEAKRRGIAADQLPMSEDEKKWELEKMGDPNSADPKEKEKFHQWKYRRWAELYQYKNLLESRTEEMIREFGPLNIDADQAREGFRKYLTVVFDAPGSIAGNLRNDKKAERLLPRPEAVGTAEDETGLQAIQKKLQELPDQPESLRGRFAEWRRISMNVARSVSILNHLGMYDGNAFTGNNGQNMELLRASQADALAASVAYNARRLAIEPNLGRIDTSIRSGPNTGLDAPRPGTPGTRLPDDD